MSIVWLLCSADTFSFLYFQYAEVVFRILNLCLLKCDHRASASDDGFFVEKFLNCKIVVSIKVSPTVSESSPQSMREVINSRYDSISLSYINFKLIRRFKWGSSEIFS